MSKIGLLTFISENFGTQLQAFALKRAIEKTGYPVNFLNYKRTNSSSNGVKSRGLMSLIKEGAFLKIITLLSLRKIRHKRSTAFSEFATRYVLSNSHQYTRVEDLKSASNNLDAIICGSDMIWSAEFEKYLPIYLLTWFDRTKISYAPSIGDISAAAVKCNIYADALNDFKALSCREKSASEFVSQLTGRNVLTVVDPTLLFTKDQWLGFFPNIQNSKSTGYVLVYCFSNTNRVLNESIRAICRERRTTRRNIFINSISDYINELRFGNGVFGPAEFVKIFSEASFVVVDGYHGLIFSLIFEKPFVVIHRGNDEHWSKHENRMTELLKDLGLEERYLNRDVEIPSKLLELDYTLIRKRLAQYREKSIAYLKESLSND